MKKPSANGAGQKVDLPDQVETRHPRIRWQQTQPRGGLWRQMDLIAERGTVDPNAQSGVMHSAQGTLYVKNAPRAHFTAPLVQASHDNNSVVAPQGAKLTSIAPPGITVVADRVTWRADLDRVVAEGNVRFVQLDPRTKRRTAWGGPFDRVSVDTELERLKIPGDAAEPAAH